MKYANWLMTSSRPTQISPQWPQSPVKVSMKPSQLFHTLSKLKSTPSDHPTEEIVEAGVNAVEEVEEANAAEEVVKQMEAASLQEHQALPAKVPNTLTYPRRVVRVQHAQKTRSRSIFLLRTSDLSMEGHFYTKAKVRF